MALGLEDLDRVQNNKNHSSPHKERVLRPWEGYDSLGNQTRTIAAREAVKKARKIVEKNESLIQEIKKGLSESKPKVEDSLDQEKIRFSIFDIFRKRKVDYRP